ncbi:sigma-54-dependent Fis family transcriptional regulator [Marinicauda pacifica]|uniref:DNA-binding transcriptional regulator NtrC n=1 Tax=Marinicauda pacifica TaxID=1133559 RepID=A0A4S2H8T4_9PROT|nr:sigma-54 dependent transcriptional regulator [Marinicauda pacifica]TGY92196.1 sigma-54-dependent Fis family transcriptional regulator [Marinicauda pacifica]GGE46803.1 sigma-54-dependent Fis family transcriptional regulator [Marinicauda pacifica]
MAKTVLVVDDDPTQRRLLQAVLEKQGHHPEMAESGEAAVDRVKRGGIDVVLLDLVMPGMDGMETLEVLKAREPELPVIVLTAHGGIETVVKAMRAGACDFFVKPASPERIAVSIRNAFKVRDLTGEVTRLKKTNSGQLGFKDMVADAPAMRQVVRLGERAAKSNIPILVTGQSGVGKELVARSIMAASDRAGRPFVAVNCGAIPENLVESVLFGHEKGAFTGAVAKHLGKFQEADGGTLFLDEIGELPLDMQVKLLRALQEGEVDPVGGKRPVKVDVRIISATNRDLAEQVKSGEFREDLFYRLNVFPIEVPGLRERADDIPALVRHFIARFNAQEGKAVLDASSETMDMLASYEWKGNVRQLENAIFRAVVLSDGDYLTPADFPQISGMAPTLNKAPASGPDEEAVAVPDAPAETEADEDELSVSIFDDGGHVRPLEMIERDLIAFAIETYSGRMAEVARRLGVGRSTLYRKVREYDLDVDNFREAG